MNHIRRNAVLVSLATAAAACTLFFFPPSRYGFYPQCPIHAWFGIQCPGCGSTRALAALLHGHLLEAIHDNALFVALLPFAMAFTAESLRRALTQPAFRWPQIPAPPLYATLAAAFVFTIARNLA